MNDLVEVLGVLNSHSNVESFAIVSRDGRLIETTAGNTEKFAAMTAIILGAAETALYELGKGLPVRIIVDIRDCRIIILGAGPKALVAAMIKPDTSLALIEIEKAADKIRSLI
jgi:predicted regulator of Ras-like GTPase activity (Roadblock/LC7/MglB family)